jgi:hypothetical protein
MSSDMSHLIPWPSWPIGDGRKPDDLTRIGIMIDCWLVVFRRSEKWWSESQLGWWLFPIEWNIIQMFETTKQHLILIISPCFPTAVPPRHVELPRTFCLWRSLRTKPAGSDRPKKSWLPPCWLSDGWYSWENYKYIVYIYISYRINIWNKHVVYII